MSLKVQYAIGNVNKHIMMNTIYFDKPRRPM